MRAAFGIFTAYIPWLTWVYRLVRSWFSLLVQTIRDVIQVTPSPLDRMSPPSAIVCFRGGAHFVITLSGEARTMTTTGPLPAIRIPSGDERLALLDQMGARQGDRFSGHRYPTADAIIDPGRGVLFIAVDPDPDPADWAAVCGLIRAVGYTDGRVPHHRDPGEPDQDELSGVFTWRLEYVDPCVFCESHGTPAGCPVCSRVLT